MINTEQAIDMLPYFVDMYDKVQLKEMRVKITKEVTKKHKDIEPTELQGILGESMIKELIKELPKCKNEVLAIVGIASGKDIEEVREQSFAKTLVVFTQILKDKEMMEFFTMAMQ